MLAVRGLRALALTVVGALIALGAVFAVAAPAVATSGLIDGHVYESDGTTPIVGAVVTFDDGSDPHAYLTDSTDVNGYYSFTPSVTFDGEPYAVFVNGGASHLDGYALGVFDLADATSGENDFVLDPGRRITGVVRDAGGGAGVPDVIVTATGDSSGTTYFALPPTDGTGVFSIGVPVGDSYEVSAADVNNEYEIQFYDHANGCGCTGASDLVPVLTAGSPITGIDFDLLAYDDWILFSVLAERAPAPVHYPGVLIYLDKWDGSNWQPVDSKVTDSHGIAELYGYAPGPATEDFRVRFTIGGVTQKVLSYDDYIGPPFPLWDGGASVHLLSLVAGGCGCGGSFVEQDLDLLFAANPATSGGGSGGGSSSPQPATKPRVRTGTSAVATAVAATPTPTPTPIPTPTSTPSSSSSPSSSPSPTPDPTPAGDTGFPWWIILIIVIVAGIVILILVLVLRR